MVLSGDTLSAKFSSTTLRTLVKLFRLCLTSSSELAAEAPEMVGPYNPPNMEHSMTISGAIRKERRRLANGKNLPTLLVYRGFCVLDGSAAELGSQRL